jgi:hypothetical protein
MAMRIDEPRGDDVARHIQDARCPGWIDHGEISDRDDSVAVDAHVRTPARRPGAVEHSSAAQQQVEGCHSARWCHVH